jgi:phage tail sheath protein FI
MPEYLSPGVYVEEVGSGIKPIQGVGTSTGAFIGIAERGPIKKAILITNWTQFITNFGGFIDSGYLAYAVFQFFNEGGTKCYVVRAAKGTATQVLKKAEKVFGDLTVRANSEGEWGNNIKIRIDAETPPPGSAARADYFRLTVLYKDKEVEAFDNLTLDETKPDHVLKRITSRWIEIEDKGNTRPTNSTAPDALAGGANGVALTSTDWAGPDGLIYAFDPVDEINVLAIPDAQGDAGVTQAAYTYCQSRKDCFFVADTPKGLSPQDVLKFRMDKGFNSSFGALYWPWIAMADPLSGKTRLVPPSGAIVGTYSHTDVVRGVHKAPAGIEEGYLNSAADVERFVTKGEHDTLNPAGVNVIRSFPGTGIVVWGARTLSAEAEWRYINLRRLFLFIEESIDEGTQWVVFEPNSPNLWGKVKRNITAFLTRVWRDGALFGTTADEAFYVKVDAENNPQEVIDAGQLIIEVGVAPVKPAEFVIIRISQKTQGKAA